MTVFAFAAGLALGATIVGLRNIRAAREDDNRQARRERYNQIHMMGLHDALQAMTATASPEDITPAERAIIRQYRVMYAATRDEGGAREDQCEGNPLSGKRYDR